MRPRAYSWPLPNLTTRSPQGIEEGYNTHSFHFYCHLSCPEPPVSSCFLPILFISPPMFRSLPARRIPLARALATHASPSRPATSALRHDWKKEEIHKIYDTPLLELVFRAASVHREHNDATKVQLCTLMNIKSALHPP